MAIMVLPSSPRNQVRYLLGNAASQANRNAILRLLLKHQATRNPPMYKIKQAANRIKATHRRALTSAVRANLARRRQRRAVNFLVSPQGLGNVLPESIIRRNIGPHVTSGRRRHA
jgi:hypothetical protein